MISMQPIRETSGPNTPRTHGSNGRAFFVSMLSMLAWEQGSTGALQSSHNGRLPCRGCKEIFFLVPGCNIYCVFFLLCFSLTLEDCGCCSKITKEPSRDKKETAGGVTLACWDASSLSFAYEFSSRHANRNG